ncbi:putative hemolysin [Neisseria sp. P0022.S007]|uniref:putative hemolysin n=1 Tax=unclassified Neisseria TaxID=2623750 RepID=UPI003F7FD75D
MIKPLILSLAAATALAACSASEKQEPFNVNVANPASEFCVKQGGKSEIKKDKDGNEYGVCHLPDGKIVEEWEYFRQHNK